MSTLLRTLTLTLVVVLLPYGVLGVNWRKCICQLRFPPARYNEDGIQVVTFNRNWGPLACPKTVLVTSDLQSQITGDECYFYIMVQVNPRGPTDEDVRLDQVQFVFGSPTDPKMIIFSYPDYVWSSVGELKIERHVGWAPQVHPFPDLPGGGPGIDLKLKSGTYRVDYPACGLRFRIDFKSLWVNIDHDMYDGRLQFGVCGQCGRTVEQNKRFKVLSKGEDVTSLSEPMRTQVHLLDTCPAAPFLGCSSEDVEGLWKDDKCGYIINTKQLFGPDSDTHCMARGGQLPVWRRRVYFSWCKVRYCTAKLNYAGDERKWQLAICEAVNRAAQVCYTESFYALTRKYWTQSDLSFCPPPNEKGHLESSDPNGN